MNRNSRRNRNWLGIIFIAVILAILPVALFLSKQQQDIRPRAISTDSTITVCPTGPEGQNCLITPTSIPIGIQNSIQGPLVQPPLKSKPPSFSIQNLKSQNHDKIPNH